MRVSTFPTLFLNPFKLTKASVMIMHFLGIFYTPADSRQCIYTLCLRELLCLTGSFLHIITYLVNTAYAAFFMPCSFSSVGLKQIQVSLDMVFSCSVMTSQQDVPVCLLCKLLVDQGPQLSQILTGNNKPELRESIGVGRHLHSIALFQNSHLGWSPERHMVYMLSIVWPSGWNWSNHSWIQAVWKCRERIQHTLLSCL